LFRSEHLSTDGQWVLFYTSVNAPDPIQSASLTCATMHPIFPGLGKRALSGTLDSRVRMAQESLY
jgi:hypothetical protein